MWRAWACLAVILSLAVPAARAEQAWTRDRTSTALYRVGAPVAVAFEPDARTVRVPPRAQIIRVYAARAYAGTARVETSLCWGSPKGPCVLLSGSHLDSHAFDGRPARGPLWLVHRVLDWGADHPPLFVRGTVIVWFVGGVR